MLLSALLLVSSSTLVPSAQKMPACSGARILDRQWQTSLSAVERALESAQRGESVDLSSLEYHVSTLSAISEIGAKITYFGYLPDNDLRATMEKWRHWHSSSASFLCRPEPQEPGTEAGGPGGCLAQERLTRVWLSNTRALERLLENIEEDPRAPDGKMNQLVEFFDTTTAIPVSERWKTATPVVARMELTGAVAKWQEWFAATVGSMCDC